jgi:DNA adenine methylase
MSEPMRAPFPWFGGKSRVADMVWRAFGEVPNYVEPFAGSLAVLLARPSPPKIETVNDKDCYLANFWRAVQAAPEAVAAHANWPVNEADLHARHLWLVCQEGFRQRMMTDAEYFDVRIAGWWVWGISCWIGSGWCVMPNWNGRIHAAGHRGRGIHAESRRDAGNKMWRKRPSLGRSGRGVHGMGLKQQIPDLAGDSGAAGRGIHASGLGEERADATIEWMQALCERLRNVRVCCGDWSRVMGRSPTECIGITGILLDPPYGTDALRSKNIYSEDDLTIAAAVRDWAVEHGDDERYRIALCGYEGEHQMPESWRCLQWKANGGLANAGNGQGRENAMRERIWFSPHCLDHEAQRELFQTA